MKFKNKLIISLTLICSLFENNAYAKDFAVNCENKNLSTPILLSFNVNCSTKPIKFIEPHSRLTDKYYITTKESHFKAYTYNDAYIYLYVSFSPKIDSDKYTLQSLKDNFLFASMSLRFSEKNTGNSTFSFSLRDVIPKLDEYNRDGVKLTIDKYEDYILSGMFEGTISRITELIQSSDPNCYHGDILGQCYKYEKVNVPFLVTFNFKLE